jgi:hypothetical protein
MPRNPQSPGRARTIATRSRARRLVAVAAASLLTMLVTAAGAHAQGGAWQSLDSNGDGYYDATAQDSDGNGNFDNAWFDLDKDGWWDTQMFNSRYSDALLEILNFDMDENGEVEIQMRDGDQRVGFDYVLFDRDQDGYWDTWQGSARRIIPRSNVDYMRQSNRRNASSRLMHDFRMRTGMSLLYPSVQMPY